MHELALSRAIVEAALRHAEGRDVTVVRVRVGALRQVVPESLRFNFEIVSRETACDGARLELEMIAARLRCARCGREWDPTPRPATEIGQLVAAPSFRCPACGAGDAGVVAGQELEVESIDVEEEQCTARG
ncbi:MAG TPA: hydrogenase maturation nickel metallochaperone HypA [Solirubrobacterales bacterium]|nr:hydrogenase maturation nickel metallochaperone HypA [Solirubrobacterales bacterium]